FAMLLLAAQPARALDPAPNPPSKQDELRKERLAVVRDIARLAAEAYKTGGGSYDSVREATRMVFAAELELCTTDKERIAVIEKAVAEAKKWEDIVAQVVKAGQVPATAGLKAKADRLQVEIALEGLRARAGAQAAPPGSAQVALAEK